VFKALHSVLIGDSFEALGQGARRRREGKGREGKGREGKGREGKGREGKGREGKHSGSAG